MGLPSAHLVPHSNGVTRQHLSRCRPVNGKATDLDCESSAVTSEEESNDSPPNAGSRFPRIVGVPALPPISPPGSGPTTAPISNQPRVVDTCDSVSSPSAAHSSRSRAEADAAAAQALRQHYSAAAAAEGGRLRQLHKQLALRDVELQQARERIQACLPKLHAHLYLVLQSLYSARRADRPMEAASHPTSRRYYCRNRLAKHLQHKCCSAMAADHTALSSGRASPFLPYSRHVIRGRSLQVGPFDSEESLMQSPKERLRAFVVRRYRWTRTGCSGKRAATEARAGQLARHQSRLHEQAQRLTALTAQSQARRCHHT